MILVNTEKSVKEKPTTSVRIGVFGVGYDRYWEQFPGLYDEMIGKQEQFIRKIPDFVDEVVDFGIIDLGSGYVVVNRRSVAELQRLRR